MSGIIVYHGSNMSVPHPRILLNGYYKDFGWGFYCTNIKKQAIRWAISKKGKTIVNCYSYEKSSEINLLKFSKMTDEWLDFVARCRSGIEHNYDIVEGPMADDKIWDYVEGFIAGRFSRSAFWELAKFKHPTHQIVFCNKKALKTIRYTGCQEFKI